MPATKTPVRPKARDEEKAKEYRESKAVKRGNKGSEYNASDMDTMPPKKNMAGGKVKKMADGGMCRGMGAAKRGGKYKMS